MPPKTAIPTMTQREVELLVLALQCTKTDITIDYAKFAKVANFSNANSGKASWHAVKKKLDKIAEAGKMANAMDAGEDGVATPDPKKRKVKDEEDEETKTPVAKKPATKKARGKKVKEVASDVKGEDEEND